jgi:hypothetical protein
MEEIHKKLQDLKPQEVPLTKREFWLVER